MQHRTEAPFAMAADRRRRILEALAQDGRVVSTELSRNFDVSEDTIRRDLRDMAAEGLLQRVHGGALPLARPTPSFAARGRQAPEAKAALARASVELVRPGQVVLIDGGTTNVAVARHLPLDLHATIATNSPDVAVALAEHRHIEVILLGGRVHRESQTVIDAATVSAVRQIRADLCFLGICSVDAAAGITTPDLDEAHVKRAMVEASADVVALVTADKLGTASRYVVAPLSELTWLYTERSIYEHALAPYRAEGVSVTTV